MFDNALELYFFLVVRGLGNFYEIKNPRMPAMVTTIKSNVIKSASAISLLSDHRPEKA